MTRALAPLVLAAALVASHADAQPKVRVKVHPGTHLAGQQVRIDVQVLVPNFFMSAPRFPPLDVAGAVVTMPDESGLNLNETIGGQAYAGIQKTYVLVAQAAGTYALPPARITFTYAREPGKPTEGSVTLPATAIVVAWPGGVAPADGAGAVVARITIQQALDRDPATLHAGDALTRTIAVTAARTQAMFVPPPTLAAPDGVGVYRKDPVLSDERQDRVGLVAGHRTDRAVYTFDRPGTYVLPAVEIPWFDAQGKRQLARADGVTVTVGAAAASAGTIAPEPPPPSSPQTSRTRLTLTALVAVASLALLAIAWAMRHAIASAVRWLDALAAGSWAWLRRDRATHLPPLNPDTVQHLSASDS